MDSPAIITQEDSIDYAAVRLGAIAGDNIVVISVDPSLIVGVAEAFGRIGDSVRDIVEEIHRLSDSFAEMCVRALRREEVCYVSHPVDVERRHHTVSKTGCNAGLAQPALNRQMGALTLRERW